MKRLFLFSFLLLFCYSFSSEIGVRLPEPSVIRSQGKVPISLNKMEIHTEIKENIAITKYEMTFYNPNDVVLEGDFEFPLLDGQNVIYYALDINGKMREGVVVEKEKARVAYESIVRESVDPGILEKTSGNNYRTRIYPIPANGYKKLIIGYEEVLKKENGNLVYYLPLNYKEKVSDFLLEIKIPELGIKPVFMNKISGLDFSNMETGYYAKISKKNYAPKDLIKFTIPFENKEKIYTEKNDKETYFLANIPVNPVQEKRKTAEKITLVWDVSNSGNSRSVQKEIEFLDSYIKYLDNVEIELLTFNNTISKAGVYKIKGGDWENLKKYILNLKYDGGTKYQNLNLKNYNSKEIILVSDGIQNYGKDRPSLPNSPVIVINSSLTSDNAYLKDVAQKTGGKYIDLVLNSPEKEAENIKYEDYRLISYTYNNKDITEVYPPVSGNLENDFSFSGILKNPKAEITANFGYGNTIIESRKITIGGTSNSTGIDRIWAGKKIDTLNTDYTANKENIIDLSKKYGIVTNDTTLIVLERVSDYVKYEIEPPLELKEENDKNIASTKIEKDRKNKDALNESVEILNGIKKWYEKDFPKDAPQKSKKVVVGKEVSTSAEWDYDIDESSTAPMLYRQETPQSVNTNGNVKINIIAGKGKQNEDANGVVEYNYESIGISALKEVENTYTNTPENKALSTKENGSNSTIKIKGWDPKEPYINEYKNTQKSQLMKKYYELKGQYYEQPSFYVDTADYFIKQGLKKEAEQILSNLSEMKLESPELLKTYGYKLMELKKYDDIIEIFEELVKIKGEDPQSYRDLALAYEKNGEFQKALDTHYIILSKQWDSRFYSVKDVSLKEFNRIISLNKGIDTEKIDKRLIYPMTFDTRVVLEWTADNSDIDLYFIDPYNETGSYTKKLTRIGSRLSGDITRGFGPEEFSLKEAVKGKYIVKVDYYGDSRQNLAGPITLKLTLYTNYGKSNEKEEVILVRVKNKKEILEIGEFFWK